MKLNTAQVKMLKQLLPIVRQQNVDLFIDDIKTFNQLLLLTRDSKNPLKVSEGDSIKANSRKYWNKRNRHKNKQNLKGA